MSNGKDILGHVKSGQVPEESIFLYHLAEEVYTYFLSGDNWPDESIFLRHLSAEIFDYFSALQSQVSNLVKEVDCPESTAVEDLVLFSATNTVKTATGNLDSAPVLAVVIEKLNSTRAVTLLLGICPFSVSGVSLNQPAYLGINGKVTPTQPGTGYIQKLGYGIGDEQLFFAPEITRVKQPMSFVFTTNMVGTFSPEIQKTGAGVEWLIDNVSYTGLNPSHVFSEAGEKEVELIFPESDFDTVTALFFNELDLTGEILGDIGRMTSLVYLWMRGNHFVGRIPPEIGQIPTLYSINVAQNDLTGEIPSEIGNCTALTVFYAYQNELTGEIPPEIGNCVNLQYFALLLNELTGEIPPEMGNCVNLKTIEIEINQLTGTIPPELGNCVNLEILKLYSNQITGTIPPELGNCVNLEVLYLHYNQLTGTIPPELGNCVNLENLYLHYNQLAGTIPPEIGNITSLKIFTINHNNFIGGIPDEIGLLTNLQLFWAGENSFTGAIASSLAELPALTQLYLNDNNFSEGDLSQFVSDLWDNRSVLGGNGCLIDISGNNGITATAIEQITGTGAYAGDGLMQAGCTVIY